MPVVPNPALQISHLFLFYPNFDWLSGMFNQSRPGRHTTPDQDHACFSFLGVDRAGRYGKYEVLGATIWNHLVMQATIHFLKIISLYLS